MRFPALSNAQGLEGGQGGEFDWLAALPPGLEARGEDGLAGGQPIDRADYEIYHLKVVPCPKRFVHDWSICPYAHAGEKARRRDPRTVNYTAIACVQMKQEGKCSMGEACRFAHSAWEYWLHPTRYHTALCKQGANCNRKICFFAHHPSELRTPVERPSLHGARSYMLPEHRPQTATHRRQAQQAQQQLRPPSPQQVVLQYSSNSSLSTATSLGMDSTPAAPAGQAIAAAAVGGMDTGALLAAAAAAAAVGTSSPGVAASGPMSVLLDPQGAARWMPPSPLRQASDAYVPVSAALGPLGQLPHPTSPLAIASAPQSSSGMVLAADGLQWEGQGAGDLQAAYQAANRRKLIQAVAGELALGRMEPEQAAALINDLLPQGSPPAQQGGSPLAVAAAALSAPQPLAPPAALLMVQSAAPGGGSEEMALLGALQQLVLAQQGGSKSAPVGALRAALGQHAHDGVAGSASMQALPGAGLGGWGGNSQGNFYG